MHRVPFKFIASAMLMFGVMAFSAVAQAGLSGQMFVGETLQYEANVNRAVFRGISIADVTFSVTLGPNPADIRIKSEAESKGTLLRLFRYSFLQQYDSIVELSSFRILRTIKHDVQKQRVRDSEAIFDYGRRQVTYIETDPKDAMRPPRRIASDIGQQIQDMISAIYWTRLQPLAVGKRFDISVSDSGLVYRVPVVIVARELQKSIVGNIACFRVQPDIFGPGRLIEQKGKMVIWITDDDRRIPVRSELNTTFGRVDIKLKGYSKAAQPAGQAPS
ncbi:MAG: DUF3108 domain-containing protein [Pyrinomonadaceae bacterium]